MSGMNERITRLRKSLGLTMEDFGAKLGIRRNTVSQLENGKTIRIPRHGSKEIATGTLHRILKDAGLK